MTCAHIVNVALKKLPGVETAEVSLNRALATVKLKPGNTLSVYQMWSLLRDKGYTTKGGPLEVRGQLEKAQGVLSLRVSGTNEIIGLEPDPADRAAFTRAEAQTGQTVKLRGIMRPAKDVRTKVPLQVTGVE